MQPFGKFGESDDPWFRIGQFAVTTTTIVAAISAAYMFVWAFEGTSNPITAKLVLSSGLWPFSGGVAAGEIWRLVTWPLPNPPSLWTLLLVAVFWMLGSQLEGLLGRRRFTFFLLALTVVPALVMTALELINISGFAYGLHYVELGVLVAFATQYSNIRFWPGIPAWGLAGIIVGMAVLQAISTRDAYDLTLTVTVALFAPLLLRALGYAEHHDWLPKFPLPVQSGSRSHRPSGRSRNRQSKRQTPGRRSSHVSAVPPTSARPSSTWPPQPPPPPPAEVAAQAKIDALLDKMGEHGLESLTDAERRALEDLSKRLRDKRVQD